MIRGILRLRKGIALALATAAAIALPPLARTAEADPAVSARSRALELAGAFANDGYKIRDGFWSAPLDGTGPALLEVNLFEGNEYWFCAAAADTDATLALEVYSGDGSLLDQQIFADGSRVAAGVEPPASGRYFVRVSLAEGEPSIFTLVYCYK